MLVMSLMDLLALDYVIFAVLLISAVLSVIRGFTKEILSITGWILSGYAAIFLGPMLKPLLARYIDIDEVVNIGSLLLVFLFVLVTFSLTTNRFINSLKASSIGALDRTLGVVFGGLRGMFIVCLSYFIAVLIIPEKDHPDWIAKARMRPLLQTGTRIMLAVVPMDRLPLNVSNITGLLSDKVPTATIEELGGQAIRGTLDRAIDETVKRETVVDEIEDSDVYTGYKQSERDLMERLIRNTERVE